MKKILHKSSAIENFSRGKITFLLGENGSGKSRELKRLVGFFEAQGAAVIAVSNTVFDRFPAKGKSQSYARLSPASGKGYVRRVLMEALFSGSDDRRDARMVGRSLQYAGFEQAVRIVPVLNINDLGSKLELIRRDERINSEDYSSISQLIKIFSSIRTRQYREEDWLRLDDPSFGHRYFFFATLVKYEKILKRLKLLRKLDCFLSKDGEIFPLHQASSGELTLIATYAFLATRMEEGAVILIDEPENSLHPRWQSEYCRRLFDLFHFYEPSIFLASHSPLVVSGAESDNLPTRIFTLSKFESSIQSEGEVKSIDGILLEAFGVVAPASHYLSELITRLLSDLSIGKKSLEEVSREIEHLRSRSYDTKQREFLRAAVDLAAKVADEFRGSKARHES